MTPLVGSWRKKKKGSRKGTVGEVEDKPGEGGVTQPGGYRSRGDQTGQVWQSGPREGLGRALQLADGASKWVVSE